MSILKISLELCILGLIMCSFLGNLVDIPCKSFMDLKSNKYSMKLIEFLNQNSLVLLNAKKLGDTSSKLTCCQQGGSSTVDTIALYLETCIVRHNTLTPFGFQSTFQLKCIRS